MPSLKISLILVTSIGIASFSVLDTNRPHVMSRSRLTTNSDSVAAGRQLAVRYCGNCHLFPEPELLDKKTWVTGVLPVMALRLGLKLPGHDTLRPLPPDEEKAISKLAIYPSEAVLSKSDWDKIVRYYESTAPEEPLPQKTHPDVTNQLPLFSAQEVFLSDKPVPQTTLLKYDVTTSRLYVGDAQQSLYVVDSLFQKANTWSIETPATDIDFPKNAAPRLLTIGIFSPSDQQKGSLLSLEQAKAASPSSVNIRNLPRPVQFATSDLNADGKEDAVICSFGNNAGKLSWFDGFNPTKEHVLKAFPGARKVEIADFNHDNKPDIMVLMAQAQEEISIFYNLGKGRFKEKTVLRFPPVFGSSYFELADFNGDGFQDILLTNGDNWDYSAINKNYHGVRIFLNDHTDTFKEIWFYPMYGASKAIARDFDNDGDLDIAATAFYSTTNQPEQGFIYLSNAGRFNFRPFSTPEAANGKWLTMEAADFDHDGDLDIVLGSYFHTVGEMSQLLLRGITSFPQLLVLNNQRK